MVPYTLCEYRIRKFRGLAQLVARVIWDDEVASSSLVTPTMEKIATHDSATGEKPANFLSWLSIPFSRTQSKTIREQYDAGCRSFDIRVREYGDNWHCAHGVFITKRTAIGILAEIDSFEDRCQVCVTYEGRKSNEFERFALCLKENFKHIIWGAISYKFSRGSAFPKYDRAFAADADYEGGVQGFLPLDGRSLHTFLPIPWLWDRLYTRPHIFNDNTFTFVDFL